MKLIFSLITSALLLNACGKSVSAEAPPVVPPAHDKKGCGCKLDMSEERESPVSLCEKGEVLRGYFIKASKYVFACAKPKMDCHCEVK